MKAKKGFGPVLLSMAFLAPAFAGPVQDKVADKYATVPFDQQHLTSGMLAERMNVNLDQRLLKVDEKALVDGFLHRPGSHPWIGEHAGKFLHAAANTYAYTHDARLKELMDRVAVTLMSAQMPDGYLGTYTEDKRWTSWDVWSHKYDLIGLLAWYDVTGDERAITCCKRIGDLLATTFGDGEGQKDISLAGEHLGMAATSVLEPMCYLYRHTGEKKYLDFCRYITRSIEKHSKVISSLTEGKGVQETANAKAYEMLSNLVGLVELYRLTGDETFLTPVVNAWSDIVKHDHLYITGTMSTHEHFRPPGDLPAAPADDIGEGCVSVTWMQLNLSLLRLTGEAKYADQIQTTVYNHLLAAQNPTNGDICYYTSLLGPKPYVHTINCCLSSVPRGIALIPAALWGSSTEEPAVMVNLYAPGEATAVVTSPEDGKPVKVSIRTETDFPRTGNVKVRVSADRESTVMLRFLQPSWCPELELSSGDGKIEEKWPTFRRAGQYVEIGKRVGAEGVAFTFALPMPARLIPGGMSYPTSFAVRRGPQVLCLDRSANADLPVPTSATVTDVGSMQPTPDGKGYTFRGQCSVPDASKKLLTVADTRLMLVPFADAASPIVWLPTPERLVRGTLPMTYGGMESQNRAVNRNQGSIVDLLPDTFRSTANRRKTENDWFAVELPKSGKIRRVVFTQGPVDVDGGWWDASGGKPEVQVKSGAEGKWTTVGTLDSYPPTTATDPAGVHVGQACDVVLPEGVEATAVRVFGKPSSGNNPNWNHVNCAELAAYAEEKE